MKKVLFVATVASHIKTFHEPFLKLFKENDYKTYVAANWNLKENNKIAYCDEFIQIPIKRSPYTIQNIKAINELKKLIKKEKFDIIHCHTPMGSVVARLAAKEARKNGTRVIYTAHGYHFYKGAPLINYPVEKWLAKYTDTQITITQEDFDLAKKKFKIKDLNLVHGVGLDEEKFNILISDEEKENLKQELKIDDKSVVCTYVAELNKNKNQQLLIKAIKRLKDDNNNVTLLLVGKGRYEPKLLKLIKKMNLEENVKLLGYRSDIVKILSITDIYLASSLREGLPVNVMEAMYMGLPIIAVDNRGHRELVQHNENGFIVEQNSAMENNMSNYLNLLVNDKHLREKFGNDSKGKVREYTLNNVINSMNKIYLLEGKINE